MQRDSSKLVGALKACAELLWIRVKLVFVKDPVERRWLKCLAQQVIYELTLCLNR